MKIELAVTKAEAFGIFLFALMALVFSYLGELIGATEYFVRGG